MSPSGWTKTFAMLISRSWRGGAPVMVASRPPSPTTRIASASAPRAAFGRPHAGRSRRADRATGPLRIVIVEDRRAERLEPIRAARARRCDHGGATRRRELDDHPRRDASGAVDQDRLTGLDGERLGHHLLGRQRGDRERGGFSHAAFSGFAATRCAEATSRCARSLDDAAGAGASS
jgi:hypothetical protein